MNSKNLEICNKAFSEMLSINPKMEISHDEMDFVVENFMDKLIGFDGDYDEAADFFFSKKENPEINFNEILEFLVKDDKFQSACGCEGDSKEEFESYLADNFTGQDLLEMKEEILKGDYSPIYFI